MEQKQHKVVHTGERIVHNNTFWILPATSIVFQPKHVLIFLSQNIYDYICNDKII